MFCFKLSFPKGVPKEDAETMASWKIDDHFYVAKKSGVPIQDIAQSLHGLSLDLRWEESKGRGGWSPTDTGEEGRPFSQLG